MLVRLTRAQRLKAGWIIALVYLLCVLAPAMSYALPGPHLIAPCLTGESHMTGMVHVGGEAQSPHRHDDHHKHAHSAAQSGEAAQSMATENYPEPGRATHASDGQCCGLMCVVALPAALFDIVRSSVPIAPCEIEGHRKIADSAPSLLYRPPIS